MALYHAFEMMAQGKPSFSRNTASKEFLPTRPKEDLL